MIQETMNWIFNATNNWVSSGVALKKIKRSGQKTTIHLSCYLVFFIETLDIPMAIEKVTAEGKSPRKKASPHIQMSQQK